MRPRRRRFGTRIAPWLACVLVTLLATACRRGEIAPEPAGGGSPKTIEHLMQRGLKPHRAGIMELLRIEPSADEDWRSLEAHATVLHDSSFELMQTEVYTQRDPYPDPVWTLAASNLNRRSRELLQSIETKDLPAAQSALRGIGETCGACHRECTAP